MGQDQSTRPKIGDTVTVTTVVRGEVVKAPFGWDKANPTGLCLHVENDSIYVFNRWPDDLVLSRTFVTEEQA